MCVIIYLLQHSKLPQSLQSSNSRDLLYLGRKKCQPTPVFLLRKFHGLRRLVGYSPWGRKESDRTERLHFHFHGLRRLPGKFFCQSWVCSRNACFTESKLNWGSWIIWNLSTSGLSWQNSSFCGNLRAASPKVRRQKLQFCWVPSFGTHRMLLLPLFADRSNSQGWSRFKVSCHPLIDGRSCK